MIHLPLILTPWAVSMPSLLIDMILTMLPSSIAGKKIGRYFGDSQLISREIFGNKSRLAEIHSQEDQDLVVGIMKLAEVEISEAAELSYWWSGLRDENDDGVWEWVESE